jgi:predicted secreted hydrolase
MRFLLLACCLLVNPVLAAQNPSGDSGAGDSREPVSSAYRSEWWQLSATLVDRQGRPWQLEWALYRQAPGPVAAKNGARGEVLVLTHAALGTPDGGYHERRFAGGDPRQAVEAAAGGGLEWEWVSRGETLFPARLSFSIGDRDVNLLLESIDATAAGVRHDPGQPQVRVRGFVDQGADKAYLRGLGRFDLESNSRALIAGAARLPAE